ncbi:unnamed protein product [marine sediment metagenome]|uniref:Uncharacterized protein n=1 Tax=marine sediment metagenome TaxID=412755 RepID=X0RH01_9ZZZZ
MRKKIICNSIITNQNDKNYNKSCKRVLGYMLENNVFEHKCHICGSIHCIQIGDPGVQNIKKGDES